jgi:hypothetical protein
MHRVMTIHRRLVLGGLAGLPALAAAPALSAPRADNPADKVDRTGDPRASAIGLVRLQGSLDPQALSPWWYEAAIYAVAEGSAPVLMLRAEGCETYAMRAGPGGQYHARGATVTAFKDAAGHAWIDQFDNPVTGKRNQVRPNILTGGTFVYPGDGSVPLPAGNATGGWVRWMESGAMIGCMMERKSTGKWQPYMETTSLWTDAASFLGNGPGVPRATFSSTFLVPWLGWMEMPGVPGHLLWHSTGQKLPSLGALPADYRARAEHLAPGVLARDPFA